MSGARATHWRCRERTLTLRKRPLIMGILNVTPDSFADGGRDADARAAVERALAMCRDGADIVDVGGESTRPGAEEVSAETELARVLPVVEDLARRADATISVDTTKAVVAEAALRAGARIINDVSAMTLDPDMARVAVESGAGVVLMHMRGTPRSMQENPRYEDVVREVRDYLAARVRALREAGAAPDALAVDPGIGFGKTAAHNVELLSRLDALAGLECPVVVGLSRKSFLGALTGRAVDDRLAGSLAALSVCILKGASVVRVHDVKESLDALRVVAALTGGGAAE